MFTVNMLILDTQSQVVKIFKLLISVLISKSESNIILLYYNNLLNNTILLNLRG